MSFKSDEAQIFLAIQATQPPQKLSLRRAVQIYNVPRQTLARRVNRAQLRAGRRNLSRLLTKAEEEELIRYVIDLDLQGFSP